MSYQYCPYDGAKLSPNLCGHGLMECPSCQRTWNKATGIVLYCESCIKAKMEQDFSELAVTVRPWWIDGRRDTEACAALAQRIWNTDAVLARPFLGMRSSLDTPYHAHSGVSLAVGPRVRATYCPICKIYITPLEQLLTFPNVMTLPPVVIRWQDGLLHCETGPAVIWPDGTGEYWLRGVRIPKAWEKGKPTPSAILRLRNAEHRRVAIDWYGREAFWGKINPEVVHHDIDGQGNERRLLCTKTSESSQDRLLKMVEVTCPSTGRLYFLRVPPGVRTCQEAVASTFNVSEYNPTKEA